MGRRLDLQTVLETVLGSRNVYFQPPPTVVMNYPCIVYKRDYAWTQYADNKPYGFMLRYSVTYIDRNPDSDIPKKLSELPMSSFNRAYSAQNLNHDVYNIYF